MNKAKKSRFGFIKWMILILNLIAVILLLISYLAPYIDPNSFLFPAFIGISYPLLLIINVFFVFFWILLKIRFSLISLIIIIIGYSFIFRNIGYSKKVEIKKHPELIKIMTYNVRNFDLYNYKPHWKHNFENRNNIFNLLTKEQPDIICFQEYIQDESEKFKTRDTIINFLKAKNVHEEFTVISKNVNKFGLATFSKFPIINKGKIIFKNSNKNICIFSDVLIDNDTVRIYNAHFESLHFSKEDYNYTENVDSLKKIDKNKSKFSRILQLLKNGYLKRASQTEIVSRHISRCKYNVILCTDLNDTPVSYSYNKVSNGLFDAFVKSGNGFSPTLISLKSLFRIDYIFYSKKFKSYNYSTINVKYSDHYPVVCYIAKN